MAHCKTESTPAPSQCSHQPQLKSRLPRGRRDGRGEALPSMRLNSEDTGGEDHVGTRQAARNSTEEQFPGQSGSDPRRLRGHPAGRRDWPRWQEGVSRARSGHAKGRWGVLDKASGCSEGAPRDYTGQSGHGSGPRRPHKELHASTCYLTGPVFPTNTW